MSETELQLALAKMLPEKIEVTFENKIVGNPNAERSWYFTWLDRPAKQSVQDTEWLHVCWLIEETLTTKEALEYYDRQISSHHASWQQRAEAIIKVKPNRI